MTTTVSFSASARCGSSILSAEFAAARALYASVGFVPCAPFGDYRSSPNSVCMTTSLD